MADLVKVGSEFIVNTQTAGQQINPAITGLVDGGFVVSWLDNGGVGSGDSDSAIKAQIFQSDGTPLGEEFLVNTQTLGPQSMPTSTSLPGGGFVISWIDYSGTGGDASQSGIRAQIFSNEGIKIGGEFRANTQTNNYQLWPIVSDLFDGNFVITWCDSSILGDGSGSSIKAQIYDLSGGKIGGEFLVNSQTSGEQTFPSVTKFDNDKFAIVWISTDLIKGQIFSESGEKIGSEFVVSGGPVGSNARPVATDLLSGGFVATWVSNGGVMAQIFDANGATVGSQISVETDGGSAFEPTVTGLLNGGFAISWASNSGVKIQEFSSNGEKIGSELIVNGKPFGGSYDAQLDLLSDGRIAVTWEEYGADSSVSGIMGQILGVGSLSGDPTISSDGGGATAIRTIKENSETVTQVGVAHPDPEVRYSITGGADATKFQIDAVTGLLAFKSAPDFEVPTDVGRNNVYNVVVRASNGHFADTQAIAVTVANVHEAPVITSNGGGVSAALMLPGSTTAVTAGMATKAEAGTVITYDIIGGADAALFQIDAATGALSFKSAPDFQAPADKGGDNVYDVIVRAFDGAQSDTQAIAVTVTPEGLFTERSDTVDFTALTPGKIDRLHQVGSKGLYDALSGDDTVTLPNIAGYQLAAGIAWDPSQTFHGGFGDDKVFGGDGADIIDGGLGHIPINGIPVARDF